jgi:hypothetical protein
MKNQVEKLDKNELIKLNFLLTMEKNQEQQKEEEVNCIKKERKEYENNIDPIWYLKNGPKIIFPQEMIPKLTIQDYVEYYRCYPTLRWSSHPELLKKIKENLTKDEKKKLVQFENYQKNKWKSAAPGNDWMKNAKSTFLYLKNFLHLSIFRYVWILFQFLFH